MLKEMLKKKQKEKNIVEQIKNSYYHYTIVPNKSVGTFVFDTKIDTYLLGKIYEYYEPNDSYSGEGSYKFPELGMTVFVDSKKLITTVICEQYLLFGNTNLIGQNMEILIQKMDWQPNLIEKSWTNVNGKDQRQTVYDFDELGLQIWVYRKKIVSVVCGNLNEIPNETGNYDNDM
ncbi:MAG: hypothetical protein HC817_07905 [Saprospiraceae bacterium]|nr:hypothetical protein [Saprospiraceae bacterium]